MARTKKVRSKKQRDNEILLLNDLADIQRRTAIKNCDLAGILDVTSSYLTVTRFRVQISQYMFPRIKQLISTLNYYQKRSKDPLFKKYFRETDQEFRTRRYKLIASFKSAYNIIFDSLENKKQKKTR